MKLVHVLLKHREPTIEGRGKHEPVFEHLYEKPEIRSVPGVPGNLEIRTQCFHCPGPRFNPRTGRDLTSCSTTPQKNKRKKKKKKKKICFAK